MTYRFAVVRLDLDVSIRDEVGNDNVIQLPNVKVLVVAGRLDVIVESVEIRRGLDEAGVRGVRRVELERIRSTLGRGPEGSAARGGSVLGEVVEELLNVVHEQLFEQQPRPRDAVLECPRPIRREVVPDSPQHLKLVSTLLERVLDKVGLSKVVVDGQRTLDKVRLKDMLLRPGDGMLNAIWEASDQAHREFLLGRVVRRRVRLGDEGNHNLGIALCS